ncbi:MAG: transposase [Elusimicrobiota bacterium]
MVKTKNDVIEKNHENQGIKDCLGKAIEINGSTAYETCNERLTAFGGFLALIKFLDLVEFKNIFEKHWFVNKRKTSLGCYRMILGCLSLLFIGFQRLGQFTYIRTDPVLCGFLCIDKLPAVSTFWRYLQSLGTHYQICFLKIIADIRERVWKIAGIIITTIHINMDTTVTTVYGNIEGSRKGHNSKHRGKKALRPALLFIEETREYLYGCQRKGETMSGHEVARHIKESKKYLPKQIEKVIFRGDGEFISHEAIGACKEVGYEYTMGNKRCTPDYPKNGWYKHGDYEYNEVIYQPIGWDSPERFVVMRIPKDKMKDRQLILLEDEQYAYRDFVTSLKWKSHKVIEDYDGRAAIEPCIGEVQKAGLLAIPSKHFYMTQSFFQLVMLAYNLWRWMNLIMNHAKKSTSNKENVQNTPQKKSDESPTYSLIPILQLKMLFIAAKIVTHGGQGKVRYSIHDARTAPLLDFMKYLDEQRRVEWQYKKVG